MDQVFYEFKEIKE